VIAKLVNSPGYGKEIWLKNSSAIAAPAH